MDVIYADPYGRERGYLRYAEGDFTIGESNSFELRIPGGLPVAEGWYLMIEGTELGGRVDGLDVDTTADYVTAVGRTWHGLLESCLVKPPAGQTHLVESGDCNEVIGRLLDRLGLGERMVADARRSGIAVSGWRFSREGERMGAYAQLRAMLRSVGAKLSVRYDAALRKAVLSAVEAGRYVDGGMDGDRTGVVISTRRPVNHLHCMGEGEGAERVTLDLYADADGRVSRRQTLFGYAHREEAYDNPGATLDELEEYGTRHLAEAQAPLRSCSLAEPDPYGRYDVDDIVGGTSTAHGVSVVARVAAKIATVDGESITYETRTETEV